MSIARVLTAVSVVGVVLAAGVSGASADESPALERAAARVLASAPAGQPLEVVVTTQASPGDRPTFTTVPVDDRADALDTIAGALGEPDTAGVDMVQPARVAARVNDPLRPKQWGLDTLAYESSARPYASGKGVTVAVVDTGVKGTHPDLVGRVRPGVDIVEPNTAPIDKNGHGTAVAGTIAAASANRKYVAGLAPSATIVPVRVLDASGRGTSNDVAAGIVWAADAGVNVINVSLTLQDTVAVRTAVAYAVSRNIVVVAAAGNAGCSASGTSSTVYPAAYPGVIGVGAIDRSGATAPYSACGSWVDVMAPGTSIMSLSIKYPKLSGCTAKRYWCLVTGTSSAAPAVAAAAALRIERTGLSTYDAATVSDQVMAATHDLGSPGRDDRTGHGLIDLRALLRTR